MTLKLHEDQKKNNNNTDLKIIIKAQSTEKQREDMQV